MHILTIQFLPINITFTNACLLMVRILYLSDITWISVAISVNILSLWLKQLFNSNCRKSSKLICVQHGKPTSYHFEVHRRCTPLKFSKRSVKCSVIYCPEILSSDQGLFVRYLEMLDTKVHLLDLYVSLNILVCTQNIFAQVYYFQVYPLCACWICQTVS